ncbi:MAG: 2-keto-4-pentenoate hydratase [Gammaproteobacteria bacterium]|jgi:2-keto-4-pentenoate hydratase
MNESELALAGAALIKARASNTPLDVAKHHAAPSSQADAYAIQAIVAAQLGATGGWKIGAPSPEGQASFAPIARAGVCASGITLHDGGTRMRGIEVEIAYRLAIDLPPRTAPYEAQDVAGAIDAVLPIIEVVETRLSDRGAANGMWALADNLSHGELVFGEPISRWQDLSLAEVAVLMHFDNAVVIERSCRNAGGHPFDLIVRLANLCGTHCGGLRAGQIVTTGSLMGLELAPVGAKVSATIGKVGTVTVNFSN